MKFTPNFWAMCTIAESCYVIPKSWN